MSKVFKDPNTGNFLTQSLFYELSYARPDFVTYTLKDEDIDVTINGEVRHLESIKRLYLECEDPTEYQFATNHLGGWSHWKRLCEKTTRLHPYIEEWREELEVKLRSQGVRQMANIAMTDKGQQAAKWLAEKGWSDKKRGAPSKEEKERELKIQTRMSSEIEDDLKRLLN